MKLLDTDETILLVTGSGITAEERDRPMAYWLKGEIDKRGDPHPHRRGIVVGDTWYVENGLFQLNPTITVGGPGVNLATQQLHEELPIVLEEGQRVFIQVGTVGDSPKACLWGVDMGATGQAVERFVTDGHLQEMLRKIWKRRPPDGGVYV